MTIAWIKLFNSLPDHPKSDELAVLLGDERAWTYVVQLWLWVSRIRPEGSLAGIPDEIVAKRGGWQGRAEAFVEALRAARFLDEDRTLHGWDEIQGAYRRKAEAEAERKRAARAAAKEAKASGGRRPDGARTSAGRPRTSGVEKKRSEEIREEEKRESEREPGSVPAADPATHARAHEVDPSPPSPEPRPTRSAAPEPRPDAVPDVPPSSGSRPADVPMPSAGRPQDGARTSQGQAADARRPSTDAPPRRARVMGEGVVGMAERAAEPKTVEELLALPYRGRTLGEDLRERFTALDGKNGRLHLDEAIADSWHWHRREDDAGRRRWSVRELPGKVADQVSKKNDVAQRNLREQQREEQRAAEARARAPDAVAPAPSPEVARRIEQRRRYNVVASELRERGERVPPFDEWVATTSSAPDAPDEMPVDLKALMQEAAARAAGR